MEWEEAFHTSAVDNQSYLLSTCGQFFNIEFGLSRCKKHFAGSPVKKYRPLGRDPNLRLLFSSADVLTT